MQTTRARRASFMLVTGMVLLSSSCVHGSKGASAKPAVTKQTALAVNKLQSPLSKEQVLLQELTGKSVSALPTQQQLKNKPLSTQHYYAGLRAAEAKNYIKAIKHFNTVLQKYPQSQEVKLAFSAKSKVYSEMGLNEPAQLNLKLSQNSMSNPTKLKKTVQMTGAQQIKK